MRWQLHEPTRTLEVNLRGESPPSREEVEMLLGDLRPILGEAEVQALVLDGERVISTGRGVTPPEIEGPIRYAAARTRTLRPGR